VQKRPSKSYAAWAKNIIREYIMNEYKEVTDYETSFQKNRTGEKTETLRCAAFKRACENRDFEISNFWKRALYFGGFIAIIFNGYVNILTGKNADAVKASPLDLYLILLGIIFSVAWLLAIKGSKQWQENWEQHINKLEDEITGPLYKTIYCEGERLYSVSKICKMLAWIIIGVWVFIFFKYLYKNWGMLKNTLSNWDTKIFVIFPILITVIVVLAAFFSCICQTKNGKLYKQYKQDEKNKNKQTGRFYQKTPKNNNASGKDEKR
jgi:uncharacterized membrane protein